MQYETTNSINDINSLQKLVQLRIDVLPLLDLWVVDDSFKYTIS